MFWEQDKKWVNLEVTPTLSLGIFLMHSARHGPTQGIGTQMNFLVGEEITDMQRGHKIHLLCEQDVLANIYFPPQTGHRFKFYQKFM